MGAGEKICEEEVITLLQCIITYLSLYFRSYFIM